VDDTLGDVTAAGSVEVFDYQDGTPMTPMTPDDFLGLQRFTPARQRAYHPQAHKRHSKNVRGPKLLHPPCTNLVQNRGADSQIVRLDLFPSRNTISLPDTTMNILSLAIDVLDPSDFKTVDDIPVGSSESVGTSEVVHSVDLSTNNSRSQKVL